MTYLVLLAPQAEEMIAELDEWWVENRPAAKDQVIKETLRITDVLATSPGIGEQYSRTDAPDIRRVRLKKTPYWAYYWTDVHEKTVWVIAVWSNQREEGPPLVIPKSR